MLLLFSASFLPAFGAMRHVPESGRNGAPDYVRVSEWAEANHLEPRWIRREESLQLSSAAARVTLTADSREAQVNGVQVWLSYPVARFGGSLYVSQLDARTALRPLLFPPRKGSDKAVTICIDPGHGGRDPGNEVGANQEKRFTLLLAKELREQLSRAGFKPVLTRSTDRFIELTDRIEFANRRKSDLFVCVHFNSAVTSRGSVRGTEVYCLSPAGASSTNSRGESGGGDWCVGNRNNDRNLYLAYQIQKALTTRLGIEDRGVRRARFAVLRDARMPAVLIEAGFMSHPTEGRKIFTDEYRKQLARTIAEAIITYKHEVER